MTQIHKLLIANRGEIALRIMRTCRAMGIDSVAVFSDADADTPHVHMADEAVRIGPPPAAESYLQAEALIEAAAQTGADAVHPGYGFLAENAEFAAACTERGLTFVGPRAEVIGLLGSKRESKRAVADAGVPVIPGYDGDDRDLETLAARAREIGFPVLLKASAGGGGKGMRVVREGDDLGTAIESARRESQGAFGDDTLLIEKYIERPRHIEFQILGDSHGNVVHLFERECSIQRRHQKIIEESPAIDADLRARMGAAAVAVGRAVGYDNAGTVEFIVDAEGNFYFLEVNTRLQVEHPVTECITGLDLVREQIRIAQGERIDVAAMEGLSIAGAAMECRLYAEDPQNGFLPTSGRIVDWQVPDMEGMRVDSGVCAGQDVSIYYDPMLAKIICHAPNRDEVVARMARFLREMSVQGVITNRDFLIRVLRHPAFRAGQIDTHFIERHTGDLFADGAADSADNADAAARTASRWRVAATAATLAAHEERRSQRAVLPDLEPGFRNNRNLDEHVEYEIEGTRMDVHYQNLGNRTFRCKTAPDGQEPVSETIVLVRWHRNVLVFADGRGLRRRVRVVWDQDCWYVHSLDGDVVVREQPRFPVVSTEAVEGGCMAPMPGKVVAVLVEEGQQVSTGQTLVVLEAMKMEHQVKAAEDGKVTHLAVTQGEQVEANQLLVAVGDRDQQ